MNIYIIKERVIIKDSNSDKIVFNIPILIIDQTIEEDISKWVINVSSKRWATRDILFDLAKIICEECPDNSIDWVATFFWIEKKRFMNNEVYQDNSVKNSGFDQMIKMIDLGMQLSEDGIDDKLRKTISLELEVNGILNRK